MLVVLNEHKLPAKATSEQILALQAAILDLPQVPELKTEHYVYNGMYCRKVHIPAGVAVVSKVHKTEHFFIGCAGSLHVSGQGDSYILSPGDVVKSEIGTKRAVFALDDVICMTLHRTDKTDIDDIFEEIVINDPNSPYDKDNKLKPEYLNLLEEK